MPESERKHLVALEKKSWHIFYQITPLCYNAHREHGFGWVAVNGLPDCNLNFRAFSHLFTLESVCIDPKLAVSHNAK